MNRSFDHDSSVLFDLGDATIETKGPPAADDHDIVSLARQQTSGLTDE